MTQDRLKKVVIATTVILMLLLFAAILALVVVNAKISNVKQLEDNLQKKLAELENQKENMEAEKDYRKTSEYIEKYAREYYDMVYGSDVVYRPKAK